MSESLKLASALPGDDTVNGLDVFAAELAKNPDGTTITAIVTFDVREVRYSVAKGTEVPTVQVRRAEAWLTEKTPQAVRDAMVARGEERLNRAPLPFGQVEGGGLDE
ncbi:MAG: hypothetical protein CVT62_10545 [Actinobacteria bacterium HGW-Actinobacteria-2]|nr:MAG: hypothetical protein CVT62_10545 [Actinobacteria bacterium HGW-Actinobacteria-2]